MAPRDANLQRVIDELANALQVAVLIAEHLELASSATAQDAIALSRNLKRATDAIQTLRADRSGE
jgi:inactivated superfamily I helicase